MKADFEQHMDIWVGNDPVRHNFFLLLKSGHGGTPPKDNPEEVQDCLRQVAEWGDPFPDNWVHTVYGAYFGQWDDDNPMWDTLSRQILSF